MSNTCNYKIGNDKRCNRPLHDEQHCIFHSKEIESKESDFMKKFWDDYKKQKKNEKGYHFDGFVFPVSITFEDREFKNGAISFKDAQFCENVAFRNTQFCRDVDFGDAIFKKEADFCKAHFSGKADFDGAKFSGTADFYQVQFSGKSDFFLAQFSGKTDFCKAQFFGKVDFHRSQFYREAFFKHVQFSKEADFSKVIFKGKTLFKSIKCLEPILFSESKFHDLVKHPLDFSLSVFKGNIDFDRVEFGSPDSPLKINSKLSQSESENEKKISQKFIPKTKSSNQNQFDIANFKGIEVNETAKFNNMKCYCKGIDFSEAKFNKQLEFKIEQKYLEKISMVGTYIYDLMGDEGISSGEDEKNGSINLGLVEALKQRKKEQKYFHCKWPFLNFSEIKRRIVKKNINLVTYIWTGIELERTAIRIPFLRKYRPKLFRYLSNNFTPILGEKVEARYPIAARDIKDDRFLMRFRKEHGILFWVWWVFADCGRSLLRWGLWSLFFAFIFAFIFYGNYLHDMTCFDIKNINGKNPFLTFFYYSVVTFTTLGFGDITPATDGMKIFIIVEVVLGYLMLGGLISILAHKLARRS